MGSSPHHEVRRLLNLSINRPANVPDLGLEELDLLFSVSRRVKLTGRLAYKLEKASRYREMPKIARNMLNSARRLADARRRLALWELNRIAWAMEDQGDFPIIAAKGCAYLLLAAPNAPGRIFADVDLILTRDDLARVESVLTRRGWRSTHLSPYDDRYYRKWTHEIPPLVHVEREVEVDLHHNILPVTARLKPRAEQLLDGVRRLKSGRYSVLSNEKIVLHAACHLMFSDDLADKLRELVDIRDLIAGFAAEDADFWAKFIDAAESLDLGRAAYYAVRYARRLINLDVPQNVLSRLERWKPNIVARRLMDRVVPEALYPPHPDHPSKYISTCRFILYVRSHWVRMPPWLLAYHLGHKFLARRTERKESLAQVSG